jgi:hypothetical protein
MDDDDLITTEDIERLAVIAGNPHGRGLCVDLPAAILTKKQIKEMIGLSKLWDNESD